MHRCATCSALIARRKLVCGKCWKRIPKALQRRLYAAWNDGNVTADYLAVRAESIAAAQEF